MKTGVTQLSYLIDLPLAHPVTTDDNFKISIGADHYWDIVEDHIVRRNGPTAMASKLGYLFSGPTEVESNVDKKFLDDYSQNNITHQQDDFSVQNFHGRKIIYLYPLISTFVGREHVH